MTRYQHRQFGTVMTIILGVAAALFLLLTEKTGTSYLGWAAAGLLLVASIVFSSLSIRIADSTLQWKFGPGLFRKEISLVDIQSAEATRTRFWESLGIHLTSRGWLYNVSGFDAVLIRLKSGKRFLLGTDEPEQLAQALNTCVTGRK